MTSPKKADRARPEVKQQEVILAEGARKQETGSDVTNEGVFVYIYNRVQHNFV